MKVLWQGSAHITGEVHPVRVMSDQGFSWAEIYVGSIWSCALDNEARVIYKRAFLESVKEQAS